MKKYLILSITLLFFSNNFVALNSNKPKRLCFYRMTTTLVYGFEDDQSCYISSEGEPVYRVIGVLKQCAFGFSICDSGAEGYFPTGS